MIREWTFGFHRPVFTRPSLWFGHCEAWGMMEDETWLFLDPQGAGLRVYTAFLYDDIQAQIAARFELCDQIITYPAPDRQFRIPLHGPMTCAAICGSLVGIRALAPSGLRRSLLANGAKVIHENPEGRPERQGRAAA